MEDISIRLATPEDAVQLSEIYRYYVENTAVTFEYEAPSADEIRSRIVSYQKRYPYLCAEIRGEIVGFAFAHAFRERAAYDYSAETSVYIRRDMRRKGVGKRLYSALENELKKMGIINLYACVAIPENGDPYLSMDSPLFHEKMGYRLCGAFTNCGRKFGRWYTMIWMEKIIGEYADDPARVIPYVTISE